MSAITATDRPGAVDTVELNDAQPAAVTHRGGPLLVEAGPGSGKTRVLVERVAAIAAAGFEEGLLPHNLHTGTVDDLAAERRLAYVALTRAADVAVCTFAARRALLPGTAGKASRFLGELPDTLLRHVPPSPKVP